MTIGYSDFKIRCFLFNFPVPVVGCLGIIEITMIRSIMSRLTPPDKQGKYPYGIIPTIFLHLESCYCSPNVTLFQRIIVKFQVK